MIKKKKFGVSEAITRGLSETIKIVENNSAEFRNTVISLARIEVDPDNPRKLMLKPEDIENGISPKDQDYATKNKELAGIIDLSKSIKNTALLHPIIVYKNNEKYRIVAGERRFLATLYLKKTEIEARIFNEKPTGFKQKLVQWFENNSREDLTLYEKIENIRSLTNTYLAHHPKSKLSCDTLANITNLSKSQAANYLTALHLPADLYQLIESGQINSLKKILEINKITSAALRKKAIESCLNNSTLEFIHSLVQQNKETKSGLRQNTSDKRGRSAIKVNMGTTTNKALIKKLILTCLKSIDSHELNNHTFDDINWDVYEDLNKAFKRFMLIFENSGVTVTNV